uniref:Ig-like domain-containing protein n=1 Tax=Pygocentrus nattereri TaxID=42514 RepID=A0AAR2JD01_PYGNA
MIYCNHQKSGGINKYCWKVATEYTYAETPNTWIHKDRFSLFNSDEALVVMYRNLRLQGAGLYQCGETGEWNHDVNLTVKPDPCCLGPNTVSGYLGETVTISCSYPEEFKTNNRFFYKWTGEYFTELIHTTETRKDRCSISDDRRSKILRVRISDVREDDGGVYFCGAEERMGSISYKSFFTEIQLQVSETSSPSTTEKTQVSSDKEDFSASCSPVIIITVSVCVALLLIGGSALIFYKLRCTKMIQGSTSSPKRMEENNTISHSACDYEEIRDIRPHSDTRATPLYSTLQLPPAPSNPPNTVYVTAQLPSNPPVQDTYSMVQLPKLTTEALTYATMSFQKNPYSPIDATVTFNQEESSTEHAPVSHHPRLELTTEY